MFLFFKLVPILIENRSLKVPFFKLKMVSKSLFVRWFDAGSLLIQMYIFFTLTNIMIYLYMFTNKKLTYEGRIIYILIYNYLYIFYKCVYIFYKDVFTNRFFFFKFLTFRQFFSHWYREKKNFILIFSTTFIQIYFFIKKKSPNTHKDAGKQD